VQLLLHPLDPIPHRLLDVEIVRDQLIPDLVEQEAGGEREALEVEVIVAADASQKRDRPRVDGEQEALAQRDAEPLEPKVLASLSVPRDDEMDIPVVAAVLGGWLFAEREVDDVVAHQPQLGHQPPPFVAISDVEIDPDEQTAGHRPRRRFESDGRLLLALEIEGDDRRGTT
jgi:hypothetical protein